MRRRRPLRLIVALVLLLPLAAAAEPATVKVFEAVARARPARDAPVLQVFAEGATLSVSEEVTDGWRRVRLADGSVAFIEDSAIRTGAGAPAAVLAPIAPAAPVAPAEPPGLTLPPPPAPSSPPPDLRARIYVKDLDHLAELVKEDGPAAATARELVARRNAALTVGGLGLGVGVVLLAVAVSKAGCHSDLNDPRFGQSCGAEGYAAGGSLAILGSMLAALVIHPKGGDLLDVVNGWNTRHPDRPFTLGGPATVSQ